MSDDMNADIREAIEKHVPSHLGKALQERLATVDGLEADVARLKKQDELQSREITKFQQRISTVINLETQAKRDLEAAQRREAEVAKREIATEVVEVRIKAADSRAQAVFALAEIAFKTVSPGASRYDLAFSGTMPSETVAYNRADISGGGSLEKSE